MAAEGFDEAGVASLSGGHNPSTVLLSPGCVPLRGMSSDRHAIGNVDSYAFPRHQRK